MNRRQELSFLLLQARRAQDPVRAEEREAFATQLGVDAGQIHTKDIFEGALQFSDARAFSAILVGGAGEYGVLDDEEPIRRMIDFVVEVAEHAHPMFASCFGFQALVKGLGGEVIEDEPNAEVGTYILTRLDGCDGDPVFSDLPKTFNAQLGHKDRAVRLPKGVTALASSDLCPFQALKIDGAPIYATQFHPELTWLDNRQRFERYMAQYGRLFGQEEAQRKLDSHKPSPEANSLLKRFVSGVLTPSSSSQ